MNLQEMNYDILRIGIIQKKKLMMKVGPFVLALHKLYKFFFFFFASHKILNIVIVQIIVRNR